MTQFYPITIVLFLAAILMGSCHRGPKIIPLTADEESPVLQPETKSDWANPFPADVQEEDSWIDNEIHQIMIKEVLPTDKYVYLKVSENEKTFWIATLKTDVKIGENFYYKGSIRQSNFESPDYNRIFEEVYFVSEIIPVDHRITEKNKGLSGTLTTKNSNTIESPKRIEIEGSVSIADLVANPERFSGTRIQISGQCTKINTEIMGRNWIHLRDGSQDDFDLVITSDVEISVGQIVTMTGVVHQERDFGSGYFFDIILEGGELVDL